MNDFSQVAAVVQSAAAVYYLCNEVRRLLPNDPERDPGIVGGSPEGQKNRGGSRGPDSRLESGIQDPKDGDHHDGENQRYLKLLREKFSTDYLTYDPKKLCEVYPDEKAIAPLVPYKEEICWVGSTLQETLAEAGAVRVKRMARPFVLNADTEMRTFQEDALKHRRAQEDALKHRRAQGHMGRGDDSVIRLQGYSNNSGGAVLRIQKAKYSDQVQSNLVMDWTDGHALKKSGFETLRAYLSAWYGSKLGPLDEPIMANTIGISVVLYYRTSNGAYLPYLPWRPKGLAVFDGGFHCTASGAAEWSDTGMTFEKIFVRNMYRELCEEVGIARNEIQVMEPLALCREFLRGGKPQIFFAGVTGLSKSELAERRRTCARALELQNELGVTERVDKQLISSDTEDLRKKLLSEPLTLEATANLYYAEKFMEQCRRAP